MARRRPSNRRRSENISFEHNGRVHLATVGYDDGGQPLEVFLEVGKPGDELNIIAKDLGVLASIAIQHGATSDEITAALSQSLSGQMHGPLGHLLQLLGEKPR